MSLKSYTGALSYIEGHNKSDIKTKKDVCGTAKHFHINAVILPIPLYIYVSNSLIKYIAFMMTAILKTFCGTEKY